MRIAVFIPCYNCEKQISRVLNQFQDGEISSLFDAIICIDNKSLDKTAASAMDILPHINVPVRVMMQNNDNYGLGGSHKVAINFARREGYEYLIVLHGDDQGSIGDIAQLLREGAHENVDFLMGARFMRESKLKDYSILRTQANYVFNFIFSLVAKRRLYDLGSGLNLFRVSTFDDDFHIKFADNLTFNYYLILAIAARRHVLRFFPLTWREDDQVSNAKLSRMGFQMLSLLTRRILGGRKFFLSEHREVVRSDYAATELGRWTQ